LRNQAKTEYEGISISQRGLRVAGTKLGTVKQTGAQAGDILVGIDKLNRGLQVRVRENQEKDGGRIEGTFDVLDAGNGYYSQYLNTFVGKTYREAKDLITDVQDAGAEKCTHILNRKEMKVWQQEDI
jgi:hypothetical protein